MVWAGHGAMLLYKWESGPVCAHKMTDGNFLVVGGQGVEDFIFLVLRVVEDASVRAHVWGSPDLGQGMGRVDLSMFDPFAFPPFAFFPFAFFDPCCLLFLKVASVRAH